VPFSTKVGWRTDSVDRSRHPALYACDWLEQIGAYAEREGLVLHIHACEQPREVEECVDEHGVRPVELLARAGCLGPHTTVVHATHASDGELDLLRQASARVCICPTTEANLGDGFAPIDRLCERGIGVCIGSDSNVRIDPLEELRELEGVADGAGVAPELIGALNARTEIAREGGCSLLARLDALDGPWLAQNWDWYVDAPERCCVWTADLADGERLVTMTEAGILAKLGLNSRGLAVGLNILHHRRDGGPMGVPVHLILRALLEQCTTVEDASSLLGDSPTSGSSAVTIVDAAGGGAVFELSPSGVARIDPRTGFLAHTNHFVDPGLGDGEASELDLDGSRARLELSAARKQASCSAAGVESSRS